MAVAIHAGAFTRLAEAMRELRCGFVGMAVQGLSHRDDIGPHEQTAYEEWHGHMQPERVRRGTRHGTGGGCTTPPI